MRSRRNGVGLCAVGGAWGASSGTSKGSVVAGESSGGGGKAGGAGVESKRGGRGALRWRR